VADRHQDRWRLALASLGVLLAAADTYVVVVALPLIMDGVGVSLDRLQRATPIISGYLLGYTAVLPLIGRIADLAGEGPVFAGCLTAFGAGSVVTATAHSLPIVVAGRALQGLGGGGLVPVSLAMVAARWPPDARGLPLGIVGAVQELGSVIGPLYGAEVVAVASWRAIFWINVPVTVLLAGGLWATRPPAPVPIRPGPDDQPRPGPPGRFDLIGVALAGVAALCLAIGLDAPARLAHGSATGRAWAPAAGGVWSPLTTPIVLTGAGLVVAFVGWELVARRWNRPLIRVGRIVAVLAQADLPGALLLATVLGGVVVLFSSASPGKQVVASSAPVLVPLICVAAIGLVIRQRRARSPLLDPGQFRARPAWGALAVNLTLGAALMAALVDIPLFARTTVDTHSETAAALVLLRFLVAVPVGAVVGGALCRRRTLAPVIGFAGMILAAGAFVFVASWNQTALGGGPRWSDLELVIAGLGFGLAIAPVNVALLGAVRPGAHALASALSVVARTVGMLAGLSALAAVALHRLYRAEARIPSPLTLCPNSPLHCAAYDRLTTDALVTDLHTIFAGAAICAGAAAVMCLAFLRRPASDQDAGADADLIAGAAGTTMWSGLRPDLG
jgi:MFS family permease